MIVPCPRCDELVQHDVDTCPECGAPRPGRVHVPKTQCGCGGRKSPRAVVCLACHLQQVAAA